MSMFGLKKPFLFAFLGSKEVVSSVQHHHVTRRPEAGLSVTKPLSSEGLPLF